MKRASLAVVLWLCASGALAGGVRPEGLGDVRSISVADEDTLTRVVIELSTHARFESHELANPRRLYIDVDGTWLDGPAAAPQPGSVGSLLRVVRGGQNTLTRSRIVLELTRPGVATKVYTLEEPFRIVAELPRTARVAQPAPAPVTAPRVDVASAPKGVTPAEKPVTVAGATATPVQPDWDQRAVRRIVIDAGHGGKDPGALGADALREARVVLAIARELQSELGERGFEVVMTRDTDVFLPLTERTDIANHCDADLFLSVHANAAKSRKLAGVETYLLDTRYDHQTARVAARENGTSVAQLTDLNLLLASLKLGNNERYAARYANLVQSSLIRRLRKSYAETIDLGVKRGPFLVLFQADMPAILVEVGFVSNVAEGRRLGSRDFAHAAAQGIADGVSAYREQQERRIFARR
ncbi:MAG TPA: N-acetylmuramoyl-L-alanine amidase [Myxococcota bacterium]|nr:N-acetylmuramoyl-L-alanine amidase [Myxococcota bacterium]